MTKKIMFLLTAAILTTGIMTGCSGGVSSSNDDSAIAQNAATGNADDTSGNNVNTVIGKNIVTDDTDDAAQGADSTTNFISEDEAASIALAKVSGATEDELRIHRDTDDGRNIYEGSIFHDGIEYDFEIDAQTGDVIEWDSEQEDDYWSGDDANYISQEEAVNIALGRVNGASESDLRIHRDSDDGQDIYEGSIIYNGMEYEFEINAQSGDVIEWDSESIYD